MIERMIEKSLFASRWLLAPFFMALALGLGVLLAKMLQAFYEFALHAWSGSEANAILYSRPDRYYADRLAHRDRHFQVTRARSSALLRNRNAAL